MAKMQREKGKRGEREVAGLLSDLTGRSVTRRVRQHDGDSDLIGLEPWCVEVKLQKTLSLDAWWQQCVDQASVISIAPWPVLFWRRHGTAVWWCRSRLCDVMASMQIFTPHDTPIDSKVVNWVAMVGLTPEK